MTLPLFIQALRRFVPLLAMGLHLSAWASSSASEPAPELWLGSWAAAPQPAMAGKPAHYQNQTLRLIVHTSAGGEQVRIKLANTYGKVPLAIGSVHIARRLTGADIDPASDRVLTFAGQPAPVIPAGATWTSDPVDLKVPALVDLAISLFLPAATDATTSHFMALQTSYVSTANGDATAAASFPVGGETASWPFLTGVEVMAGTHGATVVAFGDSVIDGDGATSDSNHRWPDILARRLQAQAGWGGEVGVLNLGIIGNRLLHGSPQGASNPAGPALGEAGLLRFERDVLQQCKVKAVIIRLGTNDIGLPGNLAPRHERVSVRALIAAYRELIARAHAQGIRVIGTTAPPFEGTDLAPGYYTARKEAQRQQFNAWMRRTDEFDAVLDFDRVLRDPKHPRRLLPSYDSGDHLHPNDAGYLALGESIPLTLFRDLSVTINN
ncbi:SGNH/GDSL hydrolase family protein [Chitinimonas sp.]|uniref:SGNH/GDSL hydrolase family protein n=1 Tax=Chitinimonas sp. TaxID=1934313 RepID=UPI002F92E981